MAANCEYPSVLLDFVKDMMFEDDRRIDPEIRHKLDNLSPEEWQQIGKKCHLYRDLNTDGLIESFEDGWTSWKIVEIFVDFNDCDTLDRYLKTGPTDHDMATRDIVHSVIANQGHLCELSTFDVLIAHLGRANYTLLVYFLAKNGADKKVGVEIPKKIERLARAMTVASLDTAITAYTDEPEIAEILRRVRESRRRRK